MLVVDWQLESEEDVLILNGDNLGHCNLHRPILSGEITLLFLLRILNTSSRHKLVMYKWYQTTKTEVHSIKSYAKNSIFSKLIIIIPGRDVSEDWRRVGRRRRESLVALNLSPLSII